MEHWPSPIILQALFHNLIYLMTVFICCCTILLHAQKYIVWYTTDSVAANIPQCIIVHKVANVLTIFSFLLSNLPLSSLFSLQYLSSEWWQLGCMRV